MRKRIPNKDSDKSKTPKYVSNRGYNKDKPFSKDSEGFKKSFGDKKRYGSDRDDNRRGGRSEDRRSSYSDDRRTGKSFDGPKKSYGESEKRSFGGRDRSDDRRGSRFNDGNKSDRRNSGSDDRSSASGYGSDRGRDSSRGGRFDDSKKSFGDNRGRGEDRRGGGYKKDNQRSSGRFDDRKKTFGDDRRSSGRDDNRNRSGYGNDKGRDSDEKPSFKKFGAGKEVNENIIQKSLDRQVGDPTPPRIDENRLKAKLPPKVKEKVGSEKRGGDVRLNKYIANAGLCSRREADELIAGGMIKVNGKVVTEMGYQVKPNDTVKYGKDILSREKMMYVLLNKPKDFITTMDDPQERRTVMELVAGACKERIYPVGRLDRNTTGLLLLTNDGELTDKLTHPSHELTKIYQAELDKPFEDEDFEKLKNEGVELEDGLIKPDDLSIVTPDRFVAGIKIHSGKNRVVRRMFAHLGYEVMKLDRTTFAGLTKKDLPRGKWRFLNEKEIIRLKYLI